MGDEQRAMGFQPLLTAHVREPQSFTLASYLRDQRGYEGLKKALTMAPDQVIDLVKQSGLRGRGGAGFRPA
jgi:NADH-quinone oxidoreductase subunit F